MFISVDSCRRHLLCHGSHQFLNAISQEQFLIDFYPTLNEAGGWGLLRLYVRILVSGADLRNPRRVILSYHAHTSSRGQMCF